MSDPWAAQTRGEAERRARNAQPYALDDIPTHADQLSLFYHYSAYRDEVYAMVYLLPGREPMPASGLSGMELFSRYWDIHWRAIWAWRASNLSDRLTHEQISGEMKARFQQMLALLEGDGWTVAQRDGLDTRLIALPVTAK